MRFEIEFCRSAPPNLGCSGCMRDSGHDRMVRNRGTEVVPRTDISASTNDALCDMGVRRRPARSLPELRDDVTITSCEDRTKQA